LKNKISINLEVSLVEIILSVLIFAVCGVIMLNCFAIGRFTQVKANDKTQAGIKAQTIFEYIKSAENSAEMNQLLKDTFADSCNDNNNFVYTDYYDVNWNRCNENEKEYFIIVLVSNELIQSGEMEDITITVEKLKPYPFVDKDVKKIIFSITTKKFFPNFKIG